MKKREIIISLIILVVGIITLGMGWHRYKNASTTKPNLIKCMVHVDENLDMSCDKCGAVLSFKDIAKYQEIKDTTEAGTVIEVKGNMPKNTVISAKDIEKEKAVELAQKYIPQIENDEVLYAYNISMNTNKQKYQPKNYEESVNVDINNIEIKDKNVSLIHIINDDEYEIIKPESNTEKGLNFKTTSFSSYIVVDVANYNVSFETPGNYKIYNEKGREIKTGTAVLENQNFTFIVEPKDGYGIGEITASTGNLSIRGDILSKTVTIDSVTADTTINISTVNAPKIIKQPTNQKGKIGDQITFSIEAENVENYEWEYKRSGESEWNSIVEWGIDPSVESITVSIVEEIRDVEVRCVLENKNFRSKYAVISNEIKVIVAQGTLEEEIEKIDESKTMITEWTIPSANTTIKLPVQGTGLNITVDWGDGTDVETVTRAFPTHTYAEAGTYEIKVSGNCPTWGYASVGTVSTTSSYYTYTQYLTKVKQFGELSATNYGFAYCSNLTEVSGENLVTSKTFENVTYMGYMFYKCTQLTSLDVTGFDTSKVTNMWYMFYECRSLTNLDVSEFNTSKVTDMSFLFDSCSKLTDIDVSGFDTSKVTDMYAMFFNCSSLISLDVSGFNTSKVTNMSFLFDSCSKLTDIDVSGFDTSKVTNMVSMFKGCNSLTSLDLSNFNTSNVTNIAWMFYECRQLTSLDLSNFDTSKVTDMTNMFAKCRNLTSLDISGFNTINVTEMVDLFWYCSSLTNLDVSNFDTSKVTNMVSMFEGCSGLTNIDLSRFDTSKVTDMSMMFRDCDNLKSLQLSNKFVIPASNVTDMFNGTSNLKSIIMIDTTPLAAQFTSIKDQLDGKTIYVPNKAAEATYEEAWSGDFSGDRIQPILELVGDEKITINKGEAYADAGATVAGFTSANSGDYTVYGYNLTSSGEVDIATAGTYKIEYTLTRTYKKGTGEVTEEIMKATRTVEVVDTAAYMITEWTIPSANTTIKLPVQGTGLNITVDWGDGTDIETVTTAFPTHIYAEAGTYEIKVRGNCPEWGYAENYKFSNSVYSTYMQYLSKVKQFGELNATQYGFSYCENLKEVSGENLVATKTFEKVRNMECMFYLCQNLTALDASDFDTRNVVNMKYMFNQCDKLTNLDVSGFDTSSVINMYCMFNGCYKVTSLDVSGFDTSNVTDMGGMFGTCLNLLSLDVSGFNTSNVTNMSSMFSLCNLTKLDVSNFDTSNVIDMHQMFMGCGKLNNVDVTLFDTSKVMDMSYMFSSCSGLTNLDVSNFDTSSVTNMSNMFSSCSGLTNLDVSNFDTSSVTNMSSMFSSCSGLTNLDVSNFDTSSVTNMSSMFRNCSGLTNLDVSEFDTNSVTTMIGMFSSCNSLIDLDVSNFDTSSVTNMSNMFSSCSVLTNLDLSKFNTSKVTSMSEMFKDCNQLRDLDVSNFDTSNVTNMSYMFRDCSALTNLDVSNFDTSNVTNMHSMFDACKTLKTLDVSSFDTSKVTDMSWVFDWCSNLKSLQLSNKFKVPTSNNGHMFNATSNLTSIIIVDSTPLANQFTSIKDQLGGKTIYVPNKEAETTYEEAWSGDFSGDRIQPILELVGDEKITINKGETYTEAGATVAGFTKANSGYYAPYGYNLTSSGEVDIATAGTYKIEYTLTRTYKKGTGEVTEEIMKATRTVEVVDTAAYMMTEWTIPSANTTIKLPVQGTGLNITVDWGDGTDVETVTTSFPAHIYTEAGTYEIKVRGNCPEWGYAGNSSIYEENNYYTYTQYLTKVKQFGELNATRYGFSKCENLIEVSGENLATKKTFEKVTDMGYMFNFCGNLTTFGTKGFDTSNVTNMEWMFRFCYSLVNIDLSELDTENATNMNAMFVGCSSLTDLDLKNFNTSKVTDMNGMFADCGSLNNLSLSSFDTSSVKDMTWMFHGCSNLTNLDLSGFETSNVANMERMFNGCSSLTNLNVSGFNTSNVTDMSGMFNDCSSLTNIDVSGFITSNVTDMSYMFEGCSSLTNIDVSGFDTTNVTDVSRMFSGCDKLTSLDISNFDTTNVTNISEMFYGCINLKSLQLSNKFVIPTSNISNMFTNTTNLTSIILVDTTPLAGQFTSVKDQLDGKTIYVPNKEAEAVYEEAWSGDFSGDRIHPILKLVGEEKITINKGETYTEAGATVAGFTSANSVYYTPYGYNLTSSGEVDTATAGTYKIEYTLTRTYNNGTGEVTEEIMKATRTVEVVDTAAYMITEWTIPSANTTIKLPVQGTGLNITVDWGDGTDVETVTTSFPAHIYAEARTYEIKVRGNCPTWGYASNSTVSTTSNFYTYTKYLTKVKQLGELNATSYGFAYCKNLTEVSGENLVASKTFEKVTDMSYMFCDCTQLTSLDVNRFNTSNVTSMRLMFSWCSGLTNLDVSNFDTSKVTDMSTMFSGCSGLTKLNVSNFDTSNVTYIGSMFYGCSGLTNLDVSKFDTSKVTSMRLMFYRCSGLTNLDVSNFDTSKVTDMVNMFYNCSSLTNLDVSNFDTSKVTNMSYMFEGCRGLTNLDVSNFDTIKVTSMNSMFYDCSGLTNLDVSDFDTSKVTGMSGMFEGCRGLTNIDVSNFDTSKVTGMSGMFYGCRDLTNIDVSNFNTSNVTSMNGMFKNCSDLTNLDVSEFDMSNVTDMRYMFSNCTNLKSLQLSNKFVIPTSNVTNMFTNTTNLTSIILVDTTPLAAQFTNIKDQLDGKTIYVPNKEAEAKYEEAWSGDFSGDRIHPILELVGDESVTVDVGSVAYTDAGYTVAGFTKDSSANYECYGYSVSSSGEVNTAVAGKYEITYTITRTYKQDGQTATSEPYEVTREIIVLAVSLVKPTLVGTYTYNGLVQTAELKLTSEDKFEILNNTRKDAGTQEIIVKIKDKNTYAWDDGTTDDVKIVWKIDPIIAEITWSATTIEFDGTQKQITATISNAVNGETITVTEYEGTTTATDVGKYTARVKALSSTNYTLEGASNIEKEWQISVAVVEMKVIMKDYSYGGTLPTPSITNNTAGRRVTYYYSENDINKNGTEWSTVKDSLSLSVGTYYMYAVVDADKNYEETLTDPVSFKVLGTELDVVITKENKIEYDGKWSNQNIYIYITKNGGANVTAYQYKMGASGNWADQVASPVMLENNMNSEVIVRGVNPAGKVVTAEKSVGLIKIDKTMPSITNVSYKNENKELSITATIDDSLSGIVAYAITPENGVREWIESTKGTKEAIVEGSGTYTIWAKDEAGNIAYKTIEAVRDVKAPVGTIIVKDAYTVENSIFYVNQKDVILQITATDDVSTSNQIKMAIYKEDAYDALNSEEDITWEQYEENKQWTLTKENADEKIYLILKDLAGNISVKVGE